MDKTAVGEWVFGLAFFVATLLGFLTLASTHHAINLSFFVVDALFFVWVWRKHSPLTLNDKRDLWWPFVCCVIIGAVMRVGGSWIRLAGQWMSGPGYSVH